jgi:hypothetical protein
MGRRSARWERRLFYFLGFDIFRRMTYDTEASSDAINRKECDHS